MPCPYFAFGTIMSLYHWIKAFHLIFMVAWFAGLFYIFRLFVYHVKYRDKPEVTAAYGVMERKLLYVIMHPAMMFTLIFGLVLSWLNPSVWHWGWFHTKLLFVAILIGYQIYAGITHKRFLKGDYRLSEKACRIINELPTLCLIIIMLLVILKPYSK